MRKNKKTIGFIFSTITIAVIIGVASGAFAQGSGEKEAEAPAMMMAGADGGGMAVPPPGVLGGDYMKPPAEELKSQLTPLQYKVTQEEGTERAFSNPMHAEKKSGIYVDIVSGEPLFSSLDKYDSRTGWPSFTQPLEEGNIVSHTDTALGMSRVEVKSYFADSHLGHVFTDGPEPTGLRYCINAASLRFIPVEELVEEGYGRYLPLFEVKS